MLLGSDAANDVQPSGIVGQGEAAPRPVHSLAIAVLGAPVADNGYFEDVAREADRRKRRKFLTMVRSRRLEGGAASDFNALAVF